MSEPSSEHAAFDGATSEFPHSRRPARDPRASVRYSLSARVIFTWSDFRGSSREGHGYTRNISQRGAFILASACPGTGDRVTLNIFLPALAGEAHELRIDAVGKVLRVEVVKEPESSAGFAVSNDSINLCAA